MATVVSERVEGETEPVSTAGGGASGDHSVGERLVVHRQALSKQARLVGLRDFSTPTLEAVERRRLQLWLVSILILIGVSGVMVLASFLPRLTESLPSEWLTPGNLRMAMLALTLGFAGYVVEKERALFRITRLLVDERVLTTALSNRLAEVNALLEAGKAINSELDLERVLDVILGSATHLLSATSGSIMLLEGRDVLKAVCVFGNEAAQDAVVPFDQGISGRVARSREALLVTGKVGGRAVMVESAMCVPLVHRGELLGVLNVNAATDRPSYSEYDLRALSLFAEHAASAIGNARLYEAERMTVRELVEMEHRKTEFLAAVSHDLRTPLTSLIGCTKLLQRERLPEATRMEVAEMIDRQADRLKRMIEDLLTAARLEAEAPPLVVPVDVAGLASEVVGDYRALGSDVSVAVLSPSPTVWAQGRAESLRRVLTNLIDNALTYGAAPVTVSVGVASGGDGQVRLTVSDCGAGIAKVDRERVFERFCRLDQARQQTGIGLGLSIVRALVVACGGSVWADDGPGGVGTSMVVELVPAVVEVP